jgi:serine/threonine protein kinase
METAMHETPVVRSWPALGEAPTKLDLGRPPERSGDGTPPGSIPGSIPGSTVAEEPEAAGEAPERPTLGRFRLVRRLGSGAMGVVYEGYDADLDRRVALKVLRREVEAQRSLQARSRMMREAQALARLRHPNVTMVFEVGHAESGEPFIAMELVEGRTLGRWLRARPRGWREIVEVFLQAGRGLAAAHRAGLVHRDFKPDNVIVDEDGSARVVDFGLARSAGMAELLPTLDPDLEGAEPGPVALHLTCTGAVLGTPAYMAPEQFDGGPPEAASDQFSFCVALFEALYGRRPFPGNDLPSLQRSLMRGEPVGPRRGVPRALYRVLRRGLSVDPARRFATMEKLLEALAACRQRTASPRALVLVAGLAAAVASYAGSTFRSTSPSSTSDSSIGTTASTFARAGMPSPP